MNKYNRWLNDEGSIMYHFVFSTIKDKKGSGVMADVYMRDNEVESYTITGNTDDKLVTDRGVVVRDVDELAALRKLPIKYDLIKWAFFGETYYHPWEDDNG